MANLSGVPDLGPLPISDQNAELQRSSIKALNSLLLDQDAILFRDERTEDYGVDGTFELKVSGGMTNFRAQVQLKGTLSAEANQDGSISLSVNTANLNYLLNGTSPIYVLFDANKKEFWYAWAHKENRRLIETNPDWRSQQTVTIRFTERLTASAVAVIIERVLREGRLQRQLHDSLARATVNEPVVVSIDATSLSITDPSEARHVLLANGPALVAAGFPREALRMFELIDFRTRELPRLQLTAGYADYMLGSHYSALGHIRQAMARAQDLSERDRNFLGRLKDTCELRVGLIDTASYRKRTQERARGLQGVESLQAELEALYFRFLGERDEDKRVASAAQISDITAKILTDSEATDAIKLAARLILLYVGGAKATTSLTHQRVLFQIRADMSVVHTGDMTRDYQNATNQLAEWQASSAKALKDAYELRHPILIAEANTVVLSIRVGQLFDNQMDALSSDRPFEIPQSAILKVNDAFTSARAIHELTGNVEGRLRLDIINADFLEMIGDLHGAKKLAEQIYPQAEAMAFADIARRAKALLDDKTLLMEFRGLVAQIKETDPDIWFGVQPDEDLRRFARATLESLRLPLDRLAVMERYCGSLREVARERCHWCRHLQMMEDLTQTQDRTTAFNVLPNRMCVCEKFGYKTSIVTSDAQGLIRGFKDLYCTACNDRSPKHQSPS